MKETVRARGQPDGPSNFFLKTMAEIEEEGRSEGWTGVIEMKDK